MNPNLTKLYKSMLRELDDPNIFCIHDSMYTQHLMDAGYITPKTTPTTRPKLTEKGRAFLNDY